MDNIEDLRKKLTALYEGVEANNVALDKASQLIQAGMAITQTAKTQIIYNKYVGDTRPIKFLETKNTDGDSNTTGERAADTA